jgi:predicted CoA-substrate-specific enzyme activase
MGNELWAGIDVGSLSAEVVIIDNAEIVSYSIIETGPESSQTAMRAMEKALAPLGSVMLQEIKYIVATGYGRVVVPFADENVTELSCHALAANHLFPSVRTVLDIGGQDCKAIRCDSDGKMVNFEMNDKCAAGTGRYLEIIARALHLGLEEIGMLSLTATQSANISSRCAVFAKSGVLLLNRAGIPKAEILAGVHDAIAERVLEILVQVGIEKELVLTGGVAKNIGVVRKLEQKAHLKILLPEEPQIMGALGAALIARQKWVGWKQKGCVAPERAGGGAKSRDVDSKTAP